MQTDVQATKGPAAGGNPGAKESQKTLSTAPGQLRVIKRNGAVVAYDESKISVAITKAYLAVEGGTAAASSRIHESVAQLSSQITDIFKRRMPSGGTIHIEDIQDQVELALMRTGEHKIARSYVIYRADRTRMRELQLAMHGFTGDRSKAWLQSKATAAWCSGGVRMDSCSGSSGR